MTDIYYIIYGTLKCTMGNFVLLVGAYEKVHGNVVDILYGQLEKWGNY